MKISLLQVKSTFELQQDARDRIAHLVECCNHRLTLNGLNIAERYIQGRLEICLKFCARQGGQHFHAFLRREMSVNAEDYSSRVQVRSRLSVMDWLRKVVVVVPHKMPTFTGAYRENFAGENTKFTHICAGLEIDRHKSEVLVPSVEFVEGEQDIVPTGIVVASRIRLAIADELDGGRGHLFCFLRKFSFERIPRPPEGEGGRSWGLSRMLNGKLVSQVVQRSAEIEQGLADDDPESARQFFAKLVPPNVDSGLVVSLGDKVIWTTFDKFGDLGFDLVDLGFGPFDLGFGVEKHFRFHDISSVIS